MESLGDHGFKKEGVAGHKQIKRQQSIHSARLITDHRGKSKLMTVPHTVLNQ